MLFIKKTANTWVPAQQFFVKTSSSTWQIAKKIFVKTSANIWQLFWPKAGPISTFSPFFSTDLAGNNVYVNNYVRIGSSLYGQNGTWNNSGFTGISYAYQVQSCSASTGGSNTIISSGTYSSGILINLTTPSFNGYSSNWAGKYLDFQITDNNTQSIPSIDSVGNGYGRVIVITNPPLNISASMGSAATTFNVNSTATYTATWNGTEAYFPDSTRYNVSWYKSTTLYSTPESIKTYATPITGSAPLWNNNGTTWTTTSTYTSTSTDNGYYIYAVETQYNSGSDYAGTTQGILKYAATAKVSPGVPVVQNYPYWTDTLGNVFSGQITSGTTLRLNFGTWSNSPTYYNYTIYYNTFPVTSITSNQAGTYTTNYVDYTFTYNSSYNNTISAYVNAGNSSGLSNIASPSSVGPVVAVVPATPTFSSSVGNFTTQGYIQSSSLRATSMRLDIYRSGTVSGSYSYYDTISTSSSTVRYDIPTNGYYYGISTGTNASGSAQANSSPAPSSPPFFYAGTPVSPTNASGYASADNAVISWNAAPSDTYGGQNFPNNVSSYEIYSQTISATPSGAVSAQYSGITGTSQTIYQGYSKQIYYFIRSRNNNTYGAWVGPAQVITGAAPSYTVTYVDSIDSSSGSVTTTQGGYVTLPSPSSVSNYTFNGWYTGSSGSGNFAGGRGNVYYPNSNISLYAYWTYTPSSIAPSIPGTPTLSYIGANSSSWNYSASWSASTGTAPITYYLHAYGSSNNFSTIQTTKGPFSSTNSGTFTLPKTSVQWKVAAYATNSAGTSGDSGLSNAQ